MSTTQNRFVSNVTIDSLMVPGQGQGCRFALSWELRDARYHIWFDNAADLDPDHCPVLVETTLFKNPPHDITSRERGFYWTRQLDPNAKSNLAHVEAARRIAIAEMLYDRALAMQRVKKAEAIQKRDKEVRDCIVREAAPALLDALELALATVQRLTEHDGPARSSVQGTIDIATAAINKAGGQS